MSNYPPSQYGGSYGSHDQSNVPYLPPAYPPQPYYLQNNQHGGQGQVIGNSNYGTYGYSHNMPAFGAVPTPPIPLFQGWNHDHVPTPPFSSAPQQSPYNGYTPLQEQQSQQYPPPVHTRWQPQDYNPAVTNDLEEMEQGEYQDRAMTENVPTPRFVSGSRRSSAGNGYHRHSPNTNHSLKPKSPIPRTPSSGMFQQAFV